MTKILGCFFLLHFKLSRNHSSPRGPKQKGGGGGIIISLAQSFFPLHIFPFSAKMGYLPRRPSLPPPPSCPLVRTHQGRLGGGRGGKEIVVHSVATGPRAEYGPIKMAGASVRPTKKSPWALGAQSVVLPTTAIFVFRIKAHVPRRYVGTYAVFPVQDTKKVNRKM